MFTGIVEDLGQVVAIDHAPTDGSALHLIVRTDVVLDDAELGASIAVNGCCLTVIEFDATQCRFALSTETLDRTALADVAVGDPVNLERPVTVEARLGGHIVLGHVDGVGEIVEAAPRLRVRLPDGLMRYLIEKGSIAVDGVSLTAFGLTDDEFEVAVIPHTADVTTLGQRRPGDRVNIEVDMLAKHVERLLAPQSAAPPRP